jgi:predicted kinase
VNRDDIRASVHGNTEWSKSKERITVAIRDAMIREGLANGLTVISDDTNLAPSVVDGLKALAKEFNASVEVQDFTHVSPEECIKRDLARERTVGAEVIWRMFNDHLKPDMRIVFNESLPKCVVFDMDGTLALMNGRGPYEYEKVSEDLPNPQVVALAHLFASQGGRLVICSGREGTEQCRRDTLNWLDKHQITYEHLFMRQEGDMRKDAIIKREILEREIVPRYHVVLAVDDRAQVVSMWRDAGIECWAVAEGNF